MLDRLHDARTAIRGAWLYWQTGYWPVNPDIESVMSKTIMDRQEELLDVIAQHNAFMHRLKAKHDA